VEYRVLRPDGSIRWICDRGFVIRDETGRTFCLAGIASDITGKKDVGKSWLTSPQKETETQ
jgi:PAS domain-containing protein